MPCAVDNLTRIAPSSASDRGQGRGHLHPQRGEGQLDSDHRKDERCQRQAHTAAAPRAA